MIGVLRHVRISTFVCKNSIIAQEHVTSGLQTTDGAANYVRKIVSFASHTVRMHGHESNVGQQSERQKDSRMNESTGSYNGIGTTP